MIQYIVIIKKLFGLEVDVWLAEQYISCNIVILSSVPPNFQVW